MLADQTRTEHHAADSVRNRTSGAGKIVTDCPDPPEVPSPYNPSRDSGGSIRRKSVS
jgi:hypothetical protein